MIQLTIIKINEYGPWTLTLGSDREHELQMLQATLYKQIQKLFSEKNCLVFLNRSDEFFVVTNGLTLEDHVIIQKKLEELFKLKLIMSIGFAQTPFDSVEVLPSLNPYFILIAELTPGVPSSTP